MQRTKDTILSDIAICESKLEELYAMSNRMSRRMNDGFSGTFGLPPSGRFFGHNGCPVFHPEKASLESELMMLYTELSKLNQSNHEKHSDAPSTSGVSRPSFWRRFFQT